MPNRYRLAACGLWVLAGSWSAKEETDGYIPDEKLRQFGARPPIILALTASPTPLCERVSNAIQFHSWSKWQKTRAELTAKRQADAERKRAYREANGTKTYHESKGRNAVTSTNSQTSGRTDSGPPARGRPLPDAHPRTRANPDPTRPDPPVVTTGGVGHQSNAHDRAPYGRGRAPETLEQQLARAEREAEEAF
jgi:hypothetical protein